jgi:hypothetical protein
MTLRCTPIAVYLVFRFLAGYFGAAFLSLAGGSVSDMFLNSEVATYVAMRHFSARVSHNMGQSDGCLYNLPLHRP